MNQKDLNLENNSFEGSTKDLKITDEDLEALEAEVCKAISQGFIKICKESGKKEDECDKILEDSTFRKIAQSLQNAKDAIDTDKLKELLDLGDIDL